MNSYNYYAEKNREDIFTQLFSASAKLDKERYEHANLSCPSCPNNGFFELKPIRGFKNLLLSLITENYSPESSLLFIDGISH